ncbi:hypothetical protein Btru_073494 [Bulinus truncatus]|nr:hypothetical protein Btru_073494 [Bulinus truncatus]
MTIFKPESHKPLSTGNWIWKPANTAQQKPKSRVKYDNLNSAIYRISLERQIQSHNSKCIKALTRFSRYVGWSLTFCMLGCIEDVVGNHPVFLILPPFCFFPSNYDGYKVSEVVSTSSGINATLVRSTSTFFSPDIKTLKLQVDYQNDYRLRVKIYDPNNARVSTGATIFDTSNTAPLIFSDQYLQIATRLSSKFLYGLGEHRSSFLQDLNTWKRLVFWNRDDVPKVDNNGYGTHPFFLNLEPSNGADGPSDAHGVFLLNSNAGEVALQPFGASGDGALTYRFIGGVIDFFIVLGPKPINVASQFTEIVGKTYFPPFWSLGFHLCKWGYATADELNKVIARNRNASIPYK